MQGEKKRLKKPKRKKSHSLSETLRELIVDFGKVKDVKETLRKFDALPGKPKTGCLLK